MNITNDFVDSVRKLCRDYDRAPDMPTRIALGDRLDAVGAQLSDGQVRQLVKILQKG